MVKGGVKTLDRMEIFGCLELLSSLCSEVEEEVAGAVSSLHKELDDGASPLSGKLVIT